METNDKLIGKKIGKLTVLEFIGKKQYKCYVGHMYSCECECGKIVPLERRNIQQSHTKSCGCLRKLSGDKNKGWKGCEKLTGRLWRSIINHAKKRKIEFNLSIEDAWFQFEKQNFLCALTNLPIYMPKNSKKDITHTASLDRKNSQLGYFKDNIQWVHKDINLMKSNLPEDKFIELCFLVSKKKDIDDNKS